MSLFYPSVGVLRDGDGFTVGIKEASIDENKTIKVTYADGTSESFDTKDGNIEPYSSGRASFTTSEGVAYTILPVEPTDGEWISEFKTPLPASNLKKVLAKGQETRDMPYLEDASEAMLAFQIPEDDYVLGVLYVNNYGAFVRRNGTWVEVSPLDSSFDGTVSYEIGRDNAAEFVKAFDNGALTVEAAKEFLIPA